MNERRRGTTWFAHGGVAGILLSAALSGCGANPDAPAANGALRGTLFFHASPDKTGRSVYKLDLASGAITSLVACVIPDVLADGRVVCGDHDLVILSPDGATSRVVVAGAPLMHSGQYDFVFKNERMSPDGRYLAYDDDVSTTSSVYVVDAATGALVAQLGNASDALFSHPAWGPDGRLYVQGSIYNFNKFPGIYRVDATFGNMTRVDANLTLPSSPAISPDGKRIAFVLGRRIWTMRSDGSAATALASPDVDQDFPVWSPDGALIVANTGNCDLIALDTAGGPYFKLSEKGIALNGSFGTCPDGQMTWRLSRIVSVERLWDREGALARTSYTRRGCRAT